MLQCGGRGRAACRGRGSRSREAGGSALGERHSENIGEFGQNILVSNGAQGYV